VRGLGNRRSDASVVQRRVMPLAARGARLFRSALVCLVLAQAVEAQVSGLDELLSFGGGLRLISVAEYYIMVLLTNGATTALAF